MKPVVVACVASLKITPAQVGAHLLDVDDWKSFRGWGPLPGIRSARFRRRTESVLGTQIEVVNTDGSTHVEEVAVWEPMHFVMRMSEFSRPLRFFATHFEEDWLFEIRDGQTRLVRTFALHPRSFVGRLVLRLIAPMLRRAVDAHLRDLAARS